MPAEQDINFLNSAVHAGIITREQASKALVEHEKRAKKGDSRAIRDVLVQDGTIAQAQLSAVTATLVTSEIGGYRVIDRLGEEGMGAVYKAEQVSIGRPVALKVLRRDLCRNEDYVQRFLKEAKLAGSFNHPNIVRVHDVGEDKGRYFVSMEWVEGETLRQLLDREGPLSPAGAAEMAAEVARALEYAEQARVIHGAINPENIMATHDGAVKLTNLGFDESVTGESVDAVFYKSPEQAKHQTGLDWRTDIYSLGATLYHMLTGQPPFQGATSSEITDKVIREEPVPPPELAQKVPDALGRILAKMMAKDPERRHRTAAEARKDLEHFLTGEGAAAPLAQAAAAGPGARLAEERAAAADDADRADRRRFLLPGIIVATLVVAALLIAMALKREDPRQSRRDRARNEQVAEHAYQAAERFAAANPTQYAPVIERFRTVARTFADSPWAQKAEKRRKQAVLGQKRHQETEAATAYTQAREFEIMNQGQTDAICQKYQAICDNYPDTPSADKARTRLTEIRTAKPLADEEACRARLDEARNLAKQERFAEAIALYELVQQNYPKTPWEYQAASGIAAAEKQAEQAFGQIKVQASAAMKSGDLDKAQALYERVIKVHRTPKQIALATAALSEIERRRREKARRIEEAKWREALRQYVKQAARTESLVKEWRFHEALAKHKALRAAAREAAVRDHADLRLQELECLAELKKQIIEALITPPPIYVRRFTKQFGAGGTVTKADDALLHAVGTSGKPYQIKWSELEPDELTKLAQLCAERSKQPSAAANLAMLYLELGDSTAARSQLESAKASGKLNSKTVEKAERLLMEREAAAAIQAIDAAVQKRDWSAALDQIRHAQQRYGRTKTFSWEASRLEQLRAEVELRVSMSLIPAGEFTMGAGARKADYHPRHQSRTGRFYIDRHEVTNVEFKRFLDESGYQPRKRTRFLLHWQNGTFPKGQAQFPVVHVSWDDAAAYAQWAGKRLPTEQEWEKAARGTDGRALPWKGNFKPGLANLETKGLAKIDAFPKDRSPYGCIGLAGNAREWTASWYQAYPGGKTRNRDYGKTHRVARGGSWHTHPQRAFCFVRWALRPADRYGDVGFRCVKDAEKD